MVLHLPHYPVKRKGKSSARSLTKDREDAGILYQHALPHPHLDQRWSARRQENPCRRACFKIGRPIGINLTPSSINIRRGEGGGEGTGGPLWSPAVVRLQTHC